MVTELIFAPEAARDVAEACAWYEEQRPGLGEEFLGCLDACLALTQRMPELHAKVHESFRRALVRRFPYAVFYEYDKGAIVIYALFHTSRHPDKWVRRLS